MNSSLCNASFLDDKNKFFHTIRQQVPVVKSCMEGDNSLLDVQIQTIELESKKKDHAFLLTNRQLIESEFTHSLAVLDEKKSLDEEAFWFYSYYIACMLENFYLAYGQYQLADEFNAHRRKIKAILAQDIIKQTNDKEGFRKTLQRNFSQSLIQLISAPKHTTSLKNYLAFVNLCRLYWVFCRLTLTSGFILASNLQLLAKLEVLLGRSINVPNIIAIMRAPNFVLNFFSVGLFLARLIIDVGLLIKHTFFPTKGEQNGATVMQRLKCELAKRQFTMGNDLVWSLINFLTNFNALTKIPGPVAAWLTALFLGFDVSMFVYRFYWAYTEYSAKKNQYQHEIDYYRSNPDSLSAEECAKHLTLLQKQMAQLDKDWQNKKATLAFCIAAAALLMTGFSLSLIFVSVAAVTASLFVCLIAAAMYCSIDQFSQFKTQLSRVQAIEKSQEHYSAQVWQEYKAARNDFIFTLVKNTVVPAFLIATFAICWPAAIALTIAYAGFELLHSFNQHNLKNNILAKDKIVEEMANECALSCG